ncbi:MAG: class I SAM-dependent methyltransferase [Deltaproteobacteria bacterium]|nr:class I SAM-dependent methyltransferase [Deltaproteobacteria bacterium]NNL32906.1 methyltransferase domain-containing protein [Flavobacteriaceae bacterium]
MKEQEQYIQALIKLHRGLERQGPGDTNFSKHILSLITELPANPRIADIGCGAGAGTLLLADRFKSKVRAVDFSREFLGELETRAKQRGLGHFVETIECDMRSLDWKPETIDLLWSEGAAYNLTFEGALKSWRPFMATNGIAVISEMSYFTSNIPESVRVYWQNAYSTMGTESENSNHANSSGFEILGIHRLPSKAWWDNYYGPLKENMNSFKHSEDSIMQSAIQETEEEMKLFEEHEKHYGYSFYIMKAV